MNTREFPFLDCPADAGAAEMAAAPARTEASPRADGSDDSAGPPRLVTRGESFQGPVPFEGGESHRLCVSSSGHVFAIATPLPKADGNPLAALTDWLNVTFPFPEGKAGISDFLVRLRSFMGPGLGALKEQSRGLHGYKVALNFDNGGAKFAYGGQRGTAFLSLPGTACALIPDWSLATNLFRDVLQARITRWDGAVDDFQGSHSVDWAVEQYQCGGFSTGGNTPSCSQAGNWLKPDGTGRTFYVGRGGNGKMMRIYEKGMQLGQKFDPWVRWELQLTNRDRVIPFDVLTEPGKYVAGAYQCTAWIQEDQCRIRTLKKTAQISYDHLVRCASTAYGPMLNVMAKVEGSVEKAFAKIRRPGVPQRLCLPLAIMPDGDAQ